MNATCDQNLKYAFFIADVAEGTANTSRHCKSIQPTQDQGILAFVTPAEFKPALHAGSSTLEQVNDAVKDSNWIYGDLFTLADITLMPTVVRLEDLGMAFMWDDLPAVATWYERLQQRPSFVKTYHPGTRIGTR